MEASDVSRGSTQTQNSPGLHRQYCTFCSDLALDGLRGRNNGQSVPCLPSLVGEKKQSIVRETAVHPVDLTH